MLDDDERAVLGAVKGILARYFPIAGELARIELSDAVLDPPDPRHLCDGPLFVAPWYVSLCVKTSGFDKMETEGALAICDRKRMLDPRIAPYLEGQLMALTTVARAATRELVKRYWAIGYLHCALPLTVLPRDATADTYRRYFLTYPWLGRFLPDRPVIAPPYVRAPAEDYLRDGKVDLPHLWTWIYQHTQRTWDDEAWDDAMIEALPEPVRILASAHTLDAMVGGNGFEVWLSQTRGADIRRAYHALGVLGATKLAALMAGGIALAAHHGAEFAYEKDKSWWRAIRTRRPRDWHEIDGHAPDRTYALLESELVPLSQKYAEAHRDALITSESPGLPRPGVLRRRGNR
ncbi:DMP19 family protein [Nannocystis radixulma]|uniref:DNA mimic protein DMP19 C-terminal domain-containing protein n=1 Tax=Nannocystis radixulma TaxID=2995305 RepID=A0ABT5BMB9_9BACT|nr:hypothetical protein [Nannocystis radixulma]MDC0675315.1 hypothetical protein [Nannocystis radixulma]